MKSNFSFYFNSNHFLALLSGLIILFSSCVKDPNHDKLTVTLEGKFAAGESAVITLDGAIIGTVTENNAITKSLDPGIYNLGFTTQKVIGTNTFTIVKEADKGFVFTVRCDAATVKVTADQDYAILDNTSLFETQHFGGAQFLPGVAQTIGDVQPRQNEKFNFFDKSGRLRYSVTKTLLYGEDWVLSIPYVQ